MSILFGLLCFIVGGLVGVSLMAMFNLYASEEDERGEFKQDREGNDNLI